MCYIAQNRSWFHYNVLSGRKDYLLRFGVLDGLRLDDLPGRGLAVRVGETIVEILKGLRKGVGVEAEAGTVIMQRLEMERKK